MSDELRPTRDLDLSRPKLLRDLAAFQLKLLLDGLRDIVLSPLSLIAAVPGLIWGGRRAAGYFYGLLLVGRKSDGWIDLFGGADRIAPRDLGEGQSSAGVDALIDGVGTLLIEQYENGAVTASAKEKISRALAVIQSKRG